MTAAKTLVAVTSFYCTTKDGVEHFFRQGDTVPANHPAVKGHEDLFAAHDVASPRDREAGAA
jgi:hypothetical protein